MKNLSLLVTFLTASHILFAQTFEKVSINTNFSGVQGKLITADLDKDGDPDAILSAVGSFAVFTNNNGTFTRTDYPEFAFNQSVFSIDVGDVDNNGFIDILHTGKNSDGTITPSLLMTGFGISLTPDPYFIAAAGAGVAYFGDVEGDGDLDVLSTAINGVIERLSHSSAYVTWVYGARFPTPEGTWQASWWDLDKDGQLEIIQTYGAPVSVAGTSLLEYDKPTMTVSSEFTFDERYLGSAMAADYDADGDLDILARYATWEKSLVGIFTNDNGHFTNSGITFADGASYQFGDMNNDGRYDVIVSGTTTSIYLQQSNGTFILLDTGVTLAESPGASIVDFDGDGDLDILSSGGAYRNNVVATNAAPTAPVLAGQLVSGPSVTLSWQPGSDDKTSTNALTYNIYITWGSSQAMPAHSLPDGKRQITRHGNAGNNLSFNLKCLVPGEYRWKVQTIDASYRGSTFSAEQSFTIDYPILKQPLDLEATVISDRCIDVRWTDRNTNEETHIISRYDITHGSIEILDTLPANATFYRDTSKSLLPDTRYHYQVIVTNCVFPYLFGMITVPVQTPPRMFVNEGWLELSHTVGSMALLGDYDRDGDLDMLITHSEASQTKLLRFNGSGYEDSGVQFNVSASVGKWIDYDNDGYIDVLLSDYDDASRIVKLILFKNEQGTSFSKVTDAFPIGDFPTLAGISIGDYDNDGDEDALVMRDEYIHIYENDNGRFTLNADISLEGYLRSHQAWADYDRDGDLDFMANMKTGMFCDEQVLVIFKNNGDKKFERVVFPTLSGLNPDYRNDIGDMAWGDYDNDGYPDIILAGQHTCNSAVSINRIYHNNQDGTFSSVADLQGVSLAVDVHWGDYDNDGDLDVFSSGSPAGMPDVRRPMRIYQNEGNNFQESDIDYLIDSYDTGGSTLGDIDHDGDLDVVIRGEANYANPSVVAYKNTYAERWDKKNQKPSAPANLRSLIPGAWSVTLSWDPSVDTETAQAGLTYNLYVIDDQGARIVNSYTTETGSHMIVSPGNVSGTSTTLKRLKPGTYRWGVQAIDKGFEASDFAEESTFTIAIVGVDDALAGLQLYPNPVSNRLTILSRQQQGTAQLQLMNAVGQPVDEVLLDKPEVTYDMSSLPAGLYIAAIYRNGTRVGTKKIIKK